MNRNHIYQNVNDALPELMGALLADGDEFGSRAGRTKELMHVGITLLQPWQREIVLPERKANVAAQIVETMWVLSGRNDVAGLAHYLPRAADFSDDGVEWRAGYGPRLRDYQGVDQLAYVVDTLRSSSGSRQAVATIWDPTVDTTPGKDIACLAGETVLWSPEGDLPIKQVADKFKRGEVARWPVYAVDPETREQRLQWATNVWQSAVKSTIRLNFDDGSHLRLTSDHRLYIKRRVPSGKRYGTAWAVSEIEAGDLKPGDRVLATHKWDSNGYEQIKKCLDENASFDNTQTVHRAYAELMHGPLPKKMDVHYRNEVKTDNRSENLEVLGCAEHAAIKMHGDDNPMRRMPVEQRVAKGQRHSEALTGRRHSEETRRKMSESAKDRPRRNNGTYLPDNHVVVSVEDGGTVPVYDFTVPGFHTALVGTGVVAHNCNNWLSFSSRFGKLDLHVGIRSNDAMWGWSGINAFEWSALQEVVAGLLGIMVGSLHFSVTSFHLYDQHWAKARRISEQDGIFRYSDSPRFDATGLDNMASFDYAAGIWFKAEAQIRTGQFVDVDAFPEPMLRSWLRVLQWYWSGDETFLEPLRGTQLHQACVVGTKPAGAPQPVVKPVKVDWPVGSARVDPVKQPFLNYVNQLHAEKHAAYGDSWKRRGEPGILGNIARKIDRIGSGADTSDETQADTAIDLLVYLAKYRCWLVNHPGDPADVERVLSQFEGEYHDPSTLVDDFAELEILHDSEDKIQLADIMLEQAFTLAESRWS